MSLKLTKHIITVIKEANKLKNVDVNNSTDKSFFTRYLRPFFHIGLTLLALYILEKGFSEKFIEFITSSLSILVGLFITALIFSFDKFYEQSKSENPTSREKLWDKQDFNYSKIYAYVTGYTIIISIFILILIVPNTLDLYNMNFNLNELEFSLKIINRESTKLFFKASLLFIQRFLIIYYLLEITINTLFVVSSMINHMRAKIERNN
ncbi:hypothetical protein [Chryseobacterium sp. Leaf201]|uniref:hypothetical protein n=1 Tax=Chryseobacterium sp. Leaf201 TaxID=1735672 RepID=UPI0006FF745F|nr:hypothetical protein [Chryseobacterium sp. Leaf201]KQM45841.1 hypothetical protein ASE55_11775 [Chryseobacterium sp. Leaf201]